MVLFLTMYGWIRSQQYFSLKFKNEHGYKLNLDNDENLPHSIIYFSRPHMSVVFVSCFVYKRKSQPP